MKSLELLQTLSSLVAPSGRETAVADRIRAEIEPYCDELFSDKIGNLIARVSPEHPAEGKRVMFTSHMDEVGFMVKNIDGDGRIRIVPLGGIDTRTMSGRRVVFGNGVCGIVMSKPIHSQSADERSKPTSFDKLYIELGAKDKAEAETLVHIGDFGTFEPKFVSLANGLYAGKALGGRASCVLLCELLRGAAADKRNGTLKNDCYFVFTVKREIARASFAAEAAAFTVRPDFAVVLDVAPAADFGGASETACGSKLGGGVVIAPADIKTIYDRTMFRNAITCCEQNGIRYQYPASAAGAGGEAGAIHKTASGSRMLSLGIPTRNLHSGAEIIGTADYEAAFSLGSALVRSLSC